MVRFKKVKLPGYFATQVSPLRRPEPSMLARTYRLEHGAANVYWVADATDSTEELKMRMEYRGYP